MSKTFCAMCGYELEVPADTIVPDDCDVVCGDCGDTLAKYQEEIASQKETGVTLQ
jgi:hypothetical protein